MATKSASTLHPSEWEQFRELTELHKYYFELIIKMAGFSFGIIGAIISYLVTMDFQDTRRLWIALSVPTLMSFGTTFFGFFGAFKAYDLSRWVKEKQSLLGLSWRPHSEILPLMLFGLAILFFIIAVILVIVIFNPNLWSNLITTLNP